MNPISSFFSHSEIDPKQLAVVGEEFQVSYGELASNVRYLAGGLTRLGVRKGTKVGLSVKPELETAFNLALLMLGATSMSAFGNILKSYGRQIEFLLAHEIQIGFNPSKQIIVDNRFFDELGMTSPLTEPAALLETDVVRIVFSSGTTGTPKGVEFTAKNLIARTDSARRNWMPLDPFMSLLGLDTVTGMQTYFWSVLHGKTYFIPGSAESNLALINDYKVRSIKTSAAKLADLVRLDEDNKGELEIIQVAGSLIPSKLGNACEAKFGIVPTYLYGSTEVGTVTRGQYRSTEPNNLGKPVEEVQFELVDETNEPVGAGVTGNIRYRKTGIPTHYWLQQPDSHSAFRDGWFYPGDQGTMNSSGELVLKGRIDDLVNAGGQKFNLLELDLWLQESNLFEDVASFQTFDEFGETQIGIAFTTNNPPIPEMLIQQIKTFLPNLTLAKLIRLKEIPRNKLGKPQRNDIVKIADSMG